MKFKKTDGYYQIIRVQDDKSETVVGYIVPSPFGRGYLVGSNNHAGGVVHLTLAKAKKYARAVY